MKRIRLAFKGFGLSFRVSAEKKECVGVSSKHDGEAPSRVKADKLPAPLRYAPTGDTSHLTVTHNEPCRADRGEAEE